MKNFILALVLLFSVNVFSQNLQDFGKDDNPFLTHNEVIFLNDYLKGYIYKDFDFIDKKVLFVTGSCASRLGKKSHFFNDVKEWKEKHNSNVGGMGLYVLTVGEKQKYNYDAILFYWCKMYPTEKRRNKLLESSQKLDNKKQYD